MITIKNSKQYSSNNYKNFKNSSSQQKSFKGAADIGLKALDGFVKMQENLSGARFVQDTVTNWVPKAIFTRSKADLAEMSFLEFLESGIFYFAPALVGEHLLRNGIFKKVSSPELTKNVSKSISEIATDSKLLKSGADKKLLPLKAGILLGTACIPAAEYALSFAKNLFTLKVFKTADFDSIANLDKSQKNTEDEAHKQNVANSAKKNIRNAAIFSGISLAAGILLAKNGDKSEFLQKLSKIILEPGTALSEKLGVKSKKVSNFLKDYLNLDFARTKKGELALSKGLLGTTAITGFFGYYKAAKDRGKLDKLEVLTRVPLVVFYTIFGSSLFESAFKNILFKKNFSPDLLKKDADGILRVPTRDKLPELAEKLAKTGDKDAQQKVLNKLIKDKAFITAVPFLFSLVFMGFSLSAINRVWTQFRYNKTHKNENLNQSVQSVPQKPTPNVFKGFVNKLN